MPHHRNKERLSAGDALFLYLEREGMPLNVASVSVFEGEISESACRAFIDLKLPLIRRYRQRVVPPPFNLGLPAWEYDPNFDIKNHVREIQLQNGTDGDLQKVAGQILSQLLDRRRPLWDFTLVRGLKGNRTGVVTRMHHCLADGLAGVSLMNVLMDHKAEVEAHASRKAKVAPLVRSAAPHLLDEVLASSVATAERVLSAQLELCNLVEAVLDFRTHNGHANKTPTARSIEAGAIPPFNELTKFMPELTAATQPLPFDIICRGKQNFRWAEIPLAEIKAVKNAFGVTVNDVALSIVAAAIQHYVELREVRVKGRYLRIVMPVNVRGNGSAKELGNRITFVPITLPLDIHGTKKLLTAIHERTMFLKRVHIAECVGLAGTMLGTIPTGVQEVIGPIVSQVPLGLCNLIFTNVPGPDSPLYLLGHRMLCCYPYVPIGGDLGLNCAMLTYCGKAYFGFSGNAQAVPNLGRLPTFLRGAFEEIRKSVEMNVTTGTQKAAQRKFQPANPAPKPGVTLSESDIRKPVQFVSPRTTTDQNENQPLVGRV